MYWIPKKKSKIIKALERNIIYSKNSNKNDDHPSLFSTGTKSALWDDQLIKISVKLFLLPLPAYCLGTLAVIIKEVAITQERQIFVFWFLSMKKLFSFSFLKVKDNKSIEIWKEDSRFKEYEVLQETIKINSEVY